MIRQFKIISAALIENSAINLRLNFFSVESISIATFQDPLLMNHRNFLTYQRVLYAFLKYQTKGYVQNANSMDTRIALHEWSLWINIKNDSFFFIFCVILLSTCSQALVLLSLHFAACFCVDSNNTQQIEYFIFIQHSSILCDRAIVFVVLHHSIENGRERANARTAVVVVVATTTTTTVAVMMKAWTYIATVHATPIEWHCVRFPPLSYYFRTMVSAIRIPKS